MKDFDKLYDYSSHNDKLYDYSSHKSACGSRLAAKKKTTNENKNQRLSLKMFKNNLSVFKEYLLLPDGRELLGLLVVTSKTVDSALNKNQAELGVLVLPVPLKVLADSNCFLDQVVQILRDLRSKTFTKITVQLLVSFNV